MNDGIDNVQMCDSDHKLCPITLQLQRSVVRRLQQFCNRREFVGAPVSDIISILLDRAENYHENFHSYASTSCRCIYLSAADTSSSSMQHDDGANVPTSGSETASAQVLARGQTSSSLSILQRDQHTLNAGEIIAVYLDENGDIVTEEQQLAVMEEKRRFVIESSHCGLLSGAADDRPPVHDDNTVHHQRRWTATMRRRWYDRVVGWQRSEDGLVHCRLCNTSMTVIERGVGLRSGNAFDHVCKHLAKPLFSCRICRQCACSLVEMRDHVRSAHQYDARTCVDFIASFEAELEAMIVTCFGRSDDDNIGATAAQPPTNNEDRKKTKRKKCQAFPPSRSAGSPTNPGITARRLCCRMIENWQRDSALYCKLCDQWLRVAAKSVWLRSETVLQHVCGHLGKPLFKCKLCPQSLTTCRQIRQHLQTAHQCGTRGQYVDQTDTAQEELKQTVICCFDWTDSVEGGPPPIQTTGKFLKTKLRPGLTDDSQRQQAIAQCRRLIRQYSISGGRVQCRLCSASLVATTANGYPLAETLYNHCLKHLTPGPYACRMCAKRAHTTANMRTHISTKHKDMPLTEFDDFTNQWHEEIMNALQQCFAENGNINNNNYDDGSGSTEEPIEQIVNTGCNEQLLDGTGIVRLVLEASSNIGTATTTQENEADQAFQQLFTPEPVATDAIYDCCDG